MNAAKIQGNLWRPGCVASGQTDQWFLIQTLTGGGAAAAAASLNSVSFEAKFISFLSIAVRLALMTTVSFASSPRRKCRKAACLRAGFFGVNGWHRSATVRERASGLLPRAPRGGIPDLTALTLDNWPSRDRRRGSSAYTFLKTKVRRDRTCTGTNIELVSANSPKHQSRVEWDTAAFFVGRLQTDLGGRFTPISGYTRLDKRLGWSPRALVDFNVTGQNPLNPGEAEVPPAYQVNSTQVQRSVLGKIRWI